MTTIITEYVKPPVPSTMYDWMAYVEGDEETTGRGQTEAEALRDLCAKLADCRQSDPAPATIAEMLASSNI